MSETPHGPYAGRPDDGRSQAPTGDQSGYQPPVHGHPYRSPYGHPHQYLPPSGPRRPATATAAAVLAFVAAGFLVLGGLALLTGGHVIYDLNRQGHLGPTAAEFAVDGTLNLVAAGVLIGGGVVYLARRPLGRALLTIGTLLVVACSIYWLVRFAHLSSIVVYGVFFDALVAVSLALTCSSGAKAWLAT